MILHPLYRFWDQMILKAVTIFDLKCRHERKQAISVEIWFKFWIHLLILFSKALAPEKRYEADSKSIVPGNAFTIQMNTLWTISGPQKLFNWHSRYFHSSRHYLFHNKIIKIMFSCINRKSLSLFHIHLHSKNTAWHHAFGFRSIAQFS